jgi:hypothetical protein
MVLVTPAPIPSVDDDAKTFKSLETLLPPAYVDVRPPSNVF